mmetsp:Transcript_23789/g.26707  ORF Transcript_23789/g.26707 Transcript_23789/m.26707 type:complete len:321 (+) Transcript_23789:145-1107(+)
MDVGENLPCAIDPQQKPETPQAVASDSLNESSKSAIDISVLKISHRSIKLAKFMINILKFIFIIPPAILGFPWLYGAAFVVERKPEIDYSWNEVGWRVFGAFSFTINVAIVFGSMHFSDLRENILDKTKYVVLICGYCVSMTLLCTSQALWGRYYEEKECGGGAKAVKYFWRKLLLVLGIYIDDTHKAVETSWTWSFSLISAVVALLCFSICDIVEKGLDYLPVTGKCNEPLTLLDENYSCSVDMVSTEFEGETVCCKITVQTVDALEYIESFGGFFFFYYAFFQMFGFFFVWAEIATVEEKTEDSQTLQPAITDASTAN